MTMYRATDVELLDRLMAHEARESFYAFRRYMHPNLKVNWFVADVCHELQQFYHSYIAGERPILVISTPPQHGKTTTVVDFIAWFLGKLPATRSIYASFSDRLGIRANLAIQRLLSSPKYQRVFPGVTLPKGAGRNTINGEAKTRNRELLELTAHPGFFRNTTVRGSITGESMDLGVLDDLIKGREAASSELIRDMTWEWLTNDFMTRFSSICGLIFIMTRWHVDDPLSRLLTSELSDKLRVKNYPAIAVADEPYRREGEALFPELKSLDFLQHVMSLMAPTNAQALYQGNPQVPGGEIILTSWFRFYEQLPPLQYRVMYADTAQKTKRANDYSVFQVWGLGRNGGIFLIDQIRGKWPAPELERRLKVFWAKHKELDKELTYGKLRCVKIEDKVSGTGLIQKLEEEYEIPVEGIPRSTDKYERVCDILGYIKSGYVWLPTDAPFVNDFLAECEAFTADDTHDFDDQIDPMCDAISDMAPQKVSLWDVV